MKDYISLIVLYLVFRVLVSHPSMNTNFSSSLTYKQVYVSWSTQSKSTQNKLYTFLRHTYFFVRNWESEASHNPFIIGIRVRELSFHSAFLFMQMTFYIESYSRTLKEPSFCIKFLPEVPVSNGLHHLSSLSSLPEMRFSTISFLELRNWINRISRWTCLIAASFSSINDSLTSYFRGEWQRRRLLSIKEKKRSISYTVQSLSPRTDITEQKTGLLWITRIRVWRLCDKFKM